MGVKTVFRSFQVQRKIIQEANKAIQGQMVNEMRKEIQSFTPVDTGRLKRSMRTKKTGVLKAEVQTETPYAVFQEYGTARQKPRAMMRKGAAAFKDKGFKILADKLK